MFNVVHEIKSDGARRARVECREDARLAVRRDARGVIETSVAQQADGEIAAFGNAAILRRDGRLVDPFLEPPNGIVVMLFNLRSDAIQLDWGGPGTLGPSDGGCARGSSLKESSPVHVLLIAPKSAGYNLEIMQALEPLLKQGKQKDADTLLDRALKLLNEPEKDKK